MHAMDTVDAMHNLDCVTMDTGRQQQPGDIFTAEQLLGKRRKRGQLEYLVQWQGFSAEHNTWEPRHNILDPQLISDFNDRMHRSRNSRRSAKSLKSKHLYHQQQLSRDKIETALRHSVAALCVTSYKPKQRLSSTDSGMSSSDEMYDTCSSSSSSPPLLHPYLGPPSPGSVSSTSSSSSPPSPCRQETECYTPRPLLTSLEQFVSTAYWRYSHHRMPPKKRWLLSEMLAGGEKEEEEEVTCCHNFPICHPTYDSISA